MTLGYRDGRPFSERIAPVGWDAEEFVLIHSHLGKTRHEVVGRWPLRGPGVPQLSLF
jgi:2'-5' RNA ligase